MITDPILADIAAMDSAALAAAADAAEEALACHRAALAALAEGWRSETGSAATELLHRQCAEATDIVAALRRAATELTLLNDGWADPAGGKTAEAVRGEGVRTADHPMAAHPMAAHPMAAHPMAAHPMTEVSGGPAGTPVSGPAGAGPGLPPDPPAVVPAAAAAPWAAQAAGGPWLAAPTSAQPAPTNVLPGGSGPALPDLGGALVGLVAQIAQTLGSYADIPGAGAVEGPAETPPAHAKAEPVAPARKPHPSVKASAVPASLPDSAVPKSAAPQPLPPARMPAAPPPELLAAERPPDPAAPVESAPPPVAAAVPDAPPPPPADVAASPAAAADTKTPCEIAADELAKVGE